MKTIDQIKEVLSRVTYKNWNFNIQPSAGGFILVLTNTGAYISEYIKEWYISSWSTDSEIVRAAYKAIMNLEHKIYTDMAADKIGTVIAKSNTVEDLCRNFSYKNWMLRGDERDTGYLMQFVFEGVDNDSPDKIETQFCRKWYIRKEDAPKFSKMSHLLMAAIEAAEEHEINEQFRYNGQPIYNPHIDMNEFSEFLRQHKYDSRKPKEIKT